MQIYIGGVTIGASAAICCYYVFQELRKCGKFLEVDKDLKSGGELVAEVLVQHGVKQLFVLSGGHVAPIYCSAEALGIQVIDVRHEVNAVFAADASWRLTGCPGVACVTAGPGVTNTVTAVQNAKMAESAVVVLGGATGTILKGRGSLQDIDHLSLMKSIVKWNATCTRVSQIAPTIQKALHICQEGVPGPVFVELPTDLLYPAAHVIENTEKLMPRGSALFNRIVRAVIRRHTNNLYLPPPTSSLPPPLTVRALRPAPSLVAKVFSLLAAAKRPVLVIGSQCMQQQSEVASLIAAVRALGVPTYCIGMARGLLGGCNDPPTVFRHKRGAALKESDLVVMCGAVLDFRFQYGASIGSRARLVVVNKSWAKTMLNRPPSLSVPADPALFLGALAALRPAGCQWPAQDDWMRRRREDDAAQDSSIRKKGDVEPASLLNPLHLCLAIDNVLTPDSVLVLDGGDFVGTAAYTLCPRQALSWLDPGVFGTLGVGAGFAMGALTARPGSLVWIMYGDGAFGFSLAELDTFVRHKMGVICIIGNDAGWTQILRDQATVLSRSTACTLAHTDYHAVAEGFGAKGFRVTARHEIPAVLQEAVAVARGGRPCVVNCLIARNDFREGSISV